jgi:hypothetical protein
VTLEQLRPVLNPTFWRRYCSTLPADAGWLLMALVEIGEPVTRKQLEAELPGEGNREPKVRRALAVLEDRNLIVRTDGKVFVKTDELEQELLATSFGGSSVLTIVVKSDDSSSVKSDEIGIVKTDDLPESSKVTETEKPDENSEKTEIVKSDEEKELPILLSASLKEESFKEKKTKKKKEGESERESYEPRTDRRIPDWVPPELWTDFCDHRNAIKNPLTTLAVSYIVADLERWLPDFGLEATLESLRRTIRSGKWIDIYKPKPLEKTRASNTPRFRMTMTEEET